MIKKKLFTAMVANSLAELSEQATEFITQLMVPSTKANGKMMLNTVTAFLKRLMEIHTRDIGTTIRFTVKEYK